MTCTPRYISAGVLGLLAGLMIPAISESIMTDVQSYRKVENIAYREGPELEDYARERCRLDIYFPEGAADFATVVWFHGGGMTAGEKYVPGELMNQGIAVVAAEYRLSPHVNAPAYIEDAAAAVAWVFKNIEQYGGSTQRVFVAGASAGGYLATMVGLDNQYLAAHGMDANRIAGLISLSGQAITHFTVRAERGISGTQPMVDELAPLFHVRGDAPPLLLVTGDRDLELFGRYEENAYFQRMMKVVGHADNELHELKGRDHGGVEAPAHSLLLEFLKRINKTISTAGETK